MGKNLCENELRERSEPRRVGWKSGKRTTWASDRRRRLAQLWLLIMSGATAGMRTLYCIVRPQAIDIIERAASGRDEHAPAAFTR